VRAIWTDDVALSTRIDRHVAHYTGQEEQARSIQLGLTARSIGDVVGATHRFGRAVELAAAADNDNALELLGYVVDVIDAATGTVRLKPHVAVVDEMTLDARSTHVVRVRDAAPEPGTSDRR
jgi:hypothetical protein